jgi:trans-aconitate 2-methyltransferase
LNWSIEQSNHSITRLLDDPKYPIHRWRRSDVIDTWDPAQYAKYQREREQPFFDLLALIRPAPAMRVLDLGCGTGTLTRLLHETLAARQTIGVDRSPRMLETAALHSPPGLRFEPGTIEAFSAHEEYDLILSNAALHWVEDHETVVGRLLGGLKPGGQLAFQVPAMHGNLTHTLADDLASEEPFQSAFAGWRRPQPVLEPAEYARLLFRAGIADPKVRLVIYPHVLPGREDVVEWMKGTLLTEYERRLDSTQFADFLAIYRARLLERLDPERPFFFPFKRILCWGQKALRS